MASVQGAARFADSASFGAARLAGFAFVVLAAQFMTIIMLGASMAPGYDISGGAISDLGVIPATAWLFNGSLVLTGLLNAAGGYLLFRAEGGLAGLIVALLAALGAIGAGILPLDRGDWHGLFALLAFVFFNVQTVITALRLIGPMRWIGVLLGVLGVAYVVVMFVGDAGNPVVFGAIGHGGAERLIVYPPMLWLMAFGGYLMGVGQPTR